MDNSYVIPYDLVFYYPAKEELNKMYNLEVPPGYVFAAGTSGSSKSALKSAVRSSLETYYLHQHPSKKVGPSEDSDVTKVVTIRNQGLRLEVSLFNATPMYYRYNSIVFLAIDSEEIQEKVGKKLLIHVSQEEFFKIIGRARNMTNLVLAGTYCFSSNTSQDYNLFPHLEDSSDQTLEESREAGTKMSTKMTSKWIPGHRYVLKKDSQYILYLGEIKEVLTSNEFVWQKRLRNHFFNFSGGGSSPYYTSYVEHGTVYLELNKYTLEKLQDYEGKSLASFVHRYLMTPEGWNSMSSYLWVRDLKAEQKLTGADMGVFMTADDSYDFNSVVKSVCGEVQGDPKNVSNLLNHRSDLYMYMSLAPDLARTNKDIASGIRSLNKEYMKKTLKDRCERSWGSPKVSLKDLTLEVVKTQLGFTKGGMFSMIDKFAPLSDNEFDQMIETSINELQGNGK